MTELRANCGMGKPLGTEKTNVIASDGGMEADLNVTIKKLLSPGALLGEIIHASKLNGLPRLPRSLSF